jgi:hypothetical protein
LPNHPQLHCAGPNDQLRIWKPICSQPAKTLTHGDTCFGDSVTKPQRDVRLF